MNSMYSCLASSRRTYRNLLTRFDLTAASFLSVVGRCCVRSDTFLTRDALQSAERGYAVVNRPSVRDVGAPQGEPQFMSTNACFRVKIVFKFQSLGKIPNISTSEPHF